MNERLLNSDISLHRRHTAMLPHDRLLAAPVGNSVSPLLGGKQRVESTSSSRRLPGQ